MPVRCLQCDAAAQLNLREIVGLFQGSQPKFLKQNSTLFRMSFAILFQHNLYFGNGVCNAIGRSHSVINVSFRGE